MKAWSHGCCTDWQMSCEWPSTQKVLNDALVSILWRPLSRIQTNRHTMLVNLHYNRELCFSMTYPSTDQASNEIMHLTLFSVRCIYTYVLPASRHSGSKLVVRAFVCPFNLVCSVAVHILSIGTSFS